MIANLLFGGATSFRIGMALTDSLDELITSGAITPQLAMKVLQQVQGFFFVFLTLRLTRGGMLV